MVAGREMACLEMMESKVVEIDHKCPEASWRNILCC